MAENMLEKVIKAREEFLASEKVKSLNDLAEELAKIKKLSKFLEDVEEELKASRKAYVSRALQLMEQQGVQKFTTEEGVTITHEFVVRGKVENSVKFFNWLDKREDSSLGKLQLAPHILPDNIKEIVNDKNTNPDDIKVMVHWKTMESYVKEVCDPLDAKTWPDGVTVEAHDDLKVKY
jgi:hypothetical protein